MPNQQLCVNGVRNQHTILQKKQVFLALELLSFSFLSSLHILHVSVGKMKKTKQNSNFFFLRKNIFFFEVKKKANVSTNYFEWCDLVTSRKLLAFFFELS